MTPKDDLAKLDKIFAPIQEEYDGGDPMLPGTIPEAKAQITQLLLEARIDEAIGFDKLHKHKLAELGLEADDDCYHNNRFAVKAVIDDRIAELKALGGNHD